MMSPEGCGLFKKPSECGRYKTRNTPFTKSVVRPAGFHRIGSSATPLLHSTCRWQNDLPYANANHAIRIRLVASVVMDANFGLSCLSKVTGSAAKNSFVAWSFNARKSRRPCARSKTTDLPVQIRLMFHFADSKQSERERLERTH